MRTIFLWLIVFLAIFESLIGFTQVVLQGSIGLYKLGEPHLDLLDSTISKTIVSDGGRLLRAYGTFPHPNILGAFLLIGLIIFIYLIKNFQIKSGIIIIFFILLLGLTLTFSRAAWLVGGIGLMGFLGYAGLRNRNDFKKNKDIFLIIVLIIFVLTTIFQWAVFPKLNFSFQEPAINLRLTYLKMGWEIFKENPILGVGLGNEVFYAKKSGLFERLGLKQELQKQPIHNMYLLILSELGLIGLILFLMFIFLTLKNILKRMESVIWLTLLGLGLFDHFLWTIPVGQVMFWGIAFCVCSLMDRMQPSEG